MSLFQNVLLKYGPDGAVISIMKEMFLTPLQYRLTFEELYTRQIFTDMNRDLYLSLLSKATYFKCAHLKIAR